MDNLPVSIENPLLRTPLALIVDDSCPVINLSHYWIEQRHAWLQRNHPARDPVALDGDISKLDRVPQTIPADFATKWGEWCGAEGIRGKFSLVPYPAGVGRVDRGFPGFPKREYDAWMEAVRQTIWPNFDITCEMLTHTHVVDLKTWQFTEEWEQYEWVNPPPEQLTSYITKAMTILREAGIPCEGVTSPGYFGREQEPAYARAILDAAIAVNGNRRPFYFLHVHDAPDAWPDVPVWHADLSAGAAVASIIGCTHDWFGGWTGYDAGHADRFITEDLAGGPLPAVLERHLPCVLVGHWPGFYYGGEETGFEVLKEVKRRLDRYDPDKTRTRWMKTSEIGWYWMARRLSTIVVRRDAAHVWQIRINSRFPTADFTLQVTGSPQRIQSGESELRQVHTVGAFQSGTFLHQNEHTALAFDLQEGETILHVTY